MAVSSVANSDTFKVTTPSDCEITLTRLFDAPRRLVFEAMTRPEHVKRWWGILDDQYSVPVCEIDFRVGGKWRFVGRGPECAFQRLPGGQCASGRLHGSASRSRRGVGRDLSAFERMARHASRDGEYPSLQCVTW
jgi:hypothetical protein